jgi:hypothetical protein
MVVIERLCVIPGETKIGDHCSLILEEDVSSFDVPVDDILGFEVLQS